MVVTQSPMDLASLSAVKSWLGISDSRQDGNLQACLTAASIFFLRETGRGPRNWQNTNQSPFNQSVTYTETYDGISGKKLFLRNFPINSVSNLLVGSVNVNASTSTLSPGYVVDDQGRAIAMRAGGGGMSPQTFAYVGRYGNGYTAGAGAAYSFAPFGVGVQQIQVTYAAGFNSQEIVGDLQAITKAWTASTAVATNDVVSDGIFLQVAQNSGTTGTVAPTWSRSKGGLAVDGSGDTQITWLNTGILAAPYTVTLQTQVTILQDNGIAYFSNGDPLVRINTAPAEGQYFIVSSGVYLFNAADAGKEVLLSYALAGTPADIVLAVIQLVSLNYKRRDWIGVRSIAMKDVGSTSYTLQIDPAIKEIVSLYTRSSFSS